MYQPVKVHVPKKVHEKLKNLVVKDKVVPVKIDLEHYGDDVLLLTPGQIIKMRNAKMKEKKSVVLRFSKKQVRANVMHEGGFLSAIMSVASKVLPTLLTGLASGVIGGLAEKVDLVSILESVDEEFRKFILLREVDCIYLLFFNLKKIRIMTDCG